MRRSLLALILIVCALGWAFQADPARAARQQEAMFQDDNHLVYATPQAVAKTLSKLQRMGVDRIRVSVFWGIVAPDPKSTTKPDFDAGDPAAYPPGAWDRYDTLVTLARERGIGVNFNVTSPAPNWATGTPDRADIDLTFDPSASEYNLFLRALGTRYSGDYYKPVAGPPAVRGSVPRQDPSIPPLPRVNYWSIWNEPNQAGWLTPQWARDPRNPKKDVETAPRIYRSLVDAAFQALGATGHGDDTILVGETAPKGLKKTTGITRAIDALRFIRQLYCLDDNLQVLQGTSAELRGCPVTDQIVKFPEQHPSLFRYTGWAHHPYELIFAPNVKPKWKDWVTIANLGDLERLLKRIFQRYGQPLPGGAKRVPLYLTEFGYQTDPPDPTAVSPAKQAAYNNQSEYIAWKDPSVKALTQFLLYDDQPVPGVPRNSPDAWLTFQTGLLFANGKRKPSYTAYQVPLFIARRSVRRGHKVSLWGGVRPALGQTVDVQFKPAKAKRYRRVRVAHTDGVRGYMRTNFTLRKAGAVRLAWRNPATTKTVYSRAISVGVK